MSRLAIDKHLQVEILASDLTTNPASLVQKAVEAFGRIDIVFHCAGVGRFGNLLELTKEDLSFTLKTNVEASFLFMQAAYAQILTQKQNFTSLQPGHRGDLVWITSIAAEEPFEQSAIYCMSKFAQRGLIEVMRLNGRRDGIRIIDVKPGATLTPMWGEVKSDQKLKMMMPEDIAQIAVDSILIHGRAAVEDITIRPLHGNV